MAIILVKNNHQLRGYTLSMKTKRQGFLLSSEKALRAVVGLSESTLRITVQPLSDDLRVRRLLCGKAAAFRDGRTPTNLPAPPGARRFRANLDSGFAMGASGMRKSPESRQQ